MTEADLFSTATERISLTQDNTFPPMNETKHLPTSTVGRSQALKLDTVPQVNRWTDGAPIYLFPLGVQELAGAELDQVPHQRRPRRHYPGQIDRCLG